MPLRSQNSFHIHCVCIFSLFFSFVALAAYFKISFLRCLGLSAVKVHAERVHKAGCYCCYYYFYYCFSGFLNWRALFRAAKAANLRGEARKQGWNGFPSLLVLVFISSHHLIMSLLLHLVAALGNVTAIPPGVSILKHPCSRWDDAACWRLQLPFQIQLSFVSLFSGCYEKPLGSQLQYSPSVALARVFS